MTMVPQHQRQTANSR